MWFIVLLVLLFPTLAHAQFGPLEVYTLPGSIVSDLVTEQSLTTPEAETNYTPIGDYLDGLNVSLWGSSCNEDFLGWVALDPNSTQTAAKETSDVLALDNTILQVTNSNMNVHDNFDAIENVSQTTINELSATQAGTDATIALAQQVELLRQMVGTLIVEVTIHNMQTLDATAREQASSANYPLTRLQQAIQPVKKGQ